MRRRTLIIIVALVLFGITGTVLRVPGSSMANTIIPGDYLLLNKYVGQIERGTILTFKYSPQYAGSNEHYRNDDSYNIGRVVGLPGEMIQIRERTVYINGQPLPEQKVMARELGPVEPLEELSSEGSGPYRVFYTKSSEEQTGFFDDYPFASQTSFKIPNDSYFVMGDHRYNSEDSRYRGPVPRDLIWGSASVIACSATMDTDEFRWDRVFKRIR